MRRLGGQHGVGKAKSTGGRQKSWQRPNVGTSPVSAEESGPHPVGEEESLKGLEQKHGPISVVVKNDLPGIFPISSLEGWVERD